MLLNKIVIYIRQGYSLKENCNNTLYNKLNAKGFVPCHVAEVGVWHPNTSNVFSYIMDGVKTTLVEPDPYSISLINEKFKQNTVTLHPVAICDFNGEVELCKRESSTFVSSLPSSPAIVNDGCNVTDSERFVAKAVKFDEIDDGTIDLITIDTEGSEWSVVKNMVSRPIVISVETHGGLYVNPHIDELVEWIGINNYKLWYLDDSDSVFVLSDKIKISSLDKLNLLWCKIKIRLKFIKKSISKKLKGNLRAIKSERR